MKTGSYGIDGLESPFPGISSENQTFDCLDRDNEIGIADASREHATATRPKQAEEHRSGGGV
jgi:hypothetical protein